MLSELKVSQFAIIDHIHIHFNSGLNILSGETGAGKSILIKSLALLMGAKSSSQDIRSNKDKATIEGAFDLSQRPDIEGRLAEMGIETDEKELIVRRVVQKSGKSKVYLNGHLSSLADLRRIVFPLVTISNPNDAPLIEITGQHENKDLISSRYQMDTLDQFCGNSKIRENIEEVFHQIHTIDIEILDLEALARQREQQMDFLQFQINEIEDLELKESEDTLLKSRIKDLREQERWLQWRQTALESISESDRSILSVLKNIMIRAPEYSLIAPLKVQLQESLAQLEDVAFQLQTMGDTEANGDETLNDLEDRLSRIRKLQKKFGEDVAQILLALKEMKAKHAQLANLSDTLEELKEQREHLIKSLHTKCQKLRKKRLEGCHLLQKEVNQELADLNMKGLKFLIAVEPITEPQSTGMDRVVFRTQTGPKDEPRDLARVASGGELSRILLSLKQVIGASHLPRTFLFDEVDTGVSGPTAQKVGAKLKNLAQHQQVICVTHLPQVASFADFHYFIEKNTGQDKVEMKVRNLNKEERIQEIARLISGEKTTKASLQHAKELLML